MNNLSDYLVGSGILLAIIALGIVVSLTTTRQSSARTHKPIKRTA